MRDVLREVLEEFCRWSGRDVVEYTQQAVYERLKGDLEELASLGIPRAKEMLEKLEGREDSREDSLAAVFEEA